LRALAFARASFYRVGAYFGFEINRRIGFWPQLVVAALASAGSGRWSSATACAASAASPNRRVNRRRTEPPGEHSLNI
jgi:hypothetical protein